jgi:hypothetical protein
MSVKECSDELSPPALEVNQGEHANVELGGGDRPIAVRAPPRCENLNKSRALRVAGFDECHAFDGIGAVQG